MLANRISRIQRLSARSRQYSSHTQTTYPFTKLRAYPFHISPEDAIVQMAPYASMLCLFQQFFGSLAARLIPGFGFKPLRPVQITPVYFPGWFIDAEVSADFKIGDVQHRASGVTQQSYLPGSDFRVLSRVSYSSDPAPATVPFTEELTHQHGVDVTCIPYTLSPFSGFDLAKSVTDPIKLRDNISFIPSSIHSNMFAAYPVLFPLYLAQYEFLVPGYERLITLFIEAATPGGCIWTDNIRFGDENLFTMLPLPSSIANFLHDLEKIVVPCLRGRQRLFFRFSGFKSVEKRQIASVVNSRINFALINQSAGPKLVDNSDIITSDADPRIRPFTVEEQEPVRRWLLLSEQIEKMTKLAESLRQLELNDASMKPVEGLEQARSNLQKAQEMVTPAWWKEWQHRSQ